MKHYVPQPETGERIRALRTARGLSTRDFGIPSSTLSRIERGERTPSLTHLVQIAQRLKTNPLELASGNHGQCPYCGRG